jgi:hypothetical protein
LCACALSLAMGLSAYIADPRFMLTVLSPI